MTPLERADWAKQLLASDVFKCAYQDVKTDIVRQLELVGLTDHNTQRELVLTLQCLNALKSRLERYVADGLQEQSKEKAAEFIERTRESLDKRFVRR